MTVWPVFPRAPDSLRFWSNLAPSRLALVDRVRDSRQTYADLNAASDKWASVLRAHGVRRGELVAVMAGNRHEVAEIFFACGRIGAALVPLNWRLSSTELGNILAHSRPALLVA